MRAVFQHSSPRFLRSCGAAALLVLSAVIALGSLESAEASCGDWLVGHDMPAHAAELAGGDNGAAAAEPAGVPARRRPCNGPSCGRAPVLPLAPSEAPSAPIDLDRAALFASLAPVDPATAGAWLVLDEPLSIPAVSGPPERPPRVV
jgi:hypothetical protein